MSQYRDGFRPGETDAPYAILAVSAFVAETRAEAEDFARPSLVSFVRLRTGRPILPPSAEQARSYTFSPLEAQVAEVIQSMQHVGTPDQVVPRIRALAERTRADEVMVVTNASDIARRVRSYELFAEAW